MRCPVLSGFLARGLRVLALALVFGGAPSLVASDTPPPPATPLNSLVRQLAAKKPAKGTPAPTPPKKEDLLRPEFRFKPARDWVLLPDLAKQLSTNETERAAVFQLLDQGTREARKLLAAEGAETDVAAATALFATQLWSVARNEELPEAHADALHAQIVAALTGPEMAKVSDADKQRYWEFCIGFPIFVLGMKEVVEDPAAIAELRKVAGLGFESLLGVKPELVDIGANGLVIRAGLEDAARELEKENAAAGAKPASAPKTSAGAPSGKPGAPAAASGITYAAPAGWTRENAAWATIFRATLFDVKNDGTPEPNREARHAGSIFILPPRAVTGDVRTTFEAVWREQFDAFNLGDTIVHYRSRVKCGLVIHYMGRFFARKTDGENTLKTYAVLYLVDLGGGRVQPVTAVAVPNDPGLGMGSFKEEAAFRALSWPLAALLSSIQPANGPAPYPAGGYFAPSDLQGNWGESSSAFGGFYVNAMTGASAGVATHSSGGSFRLGTDGTYDYSFAYATYNPQFGNSSGSTKHSGRYRLDGDIVLVSPDKPIPYKFTCCAVGVGTRRTPEGVKRILVTVSANTDGVYRAPPLVPNWDGYDGVLSWYVEK